MQTLSVLHLQFNENRKDFRRSVQQDSGYYIIK
jgi:hypothetical protein